MKVGDLAHRTAKSGDFAEQQVVRNPEDCVYSSASNYAGKGGILEIEVI